VSNYRVRQVLAIKPKLLESKLRLMVALATWMTDDSTTAAVGFEAITEQAQLARNTARDARNALAADGYLTWTSPHGRGHRTAWTMHRLPELKGVSDPDLFSETAAKGVSDPDPFTGEKKGSTEGGKRGQSQRADQQKPIDRLNRKAKNTLARSRGTPIPPPVKDVLAPRAYCTVCGFSLDPAVAADGTHPTCSAEAS
jgi:hypothetical protein